MLTVHPSACVACLTGRGGGVSAHWVSAGAERCQFRTGKCQFRTEKCQFRTGKSQFRTGKSQFRTGKCQFRTEKSQFRTEKSQFTTEKSQFRINLGETNYRIPSRANRGQADIQCGSSHTLYEYQQWISVTCKQRPSRTEPRHTRGEVSPHCIHAFYI